MDGFLEPIKRKEISIKDSRILLLGAGGAARAIVAGFQKEGADEIVIANRTKENMIGNYGLTVILFLILRNFGN